jgi:hypothetical protein
MKRDATATPEEAPNERLNIAWIVGAPITAAVAIGLGLAVFSALMG